METYTRTLRAAHRLRRALTPYFRRSVRFLALPYCYFALVNWRECRASRLQVAKDLLFIFWRLKYFPDNYGACRLWEKDRRDWLPYYGSNYDAYQRARLNKLVQRPEYEILFNDKELCQQLCDGAGLACPRMLGILDTNEDYRGRIRRILRESGQRKVIIKPVCGRAGLGIFLAVDRAEGVVIQQRRRTIPLDEFQLPGRHVVQEIVRQVDDIAAISSSAINTLRVVTLYTLDHDVRPIAVAMRFGVGEAYTDNWSAGGVAVGVDLSCGRLLETAFDKRGNRYTRHPTSGIAFGGFQVPQWDEMMQLARNAQTAFPYCRLLGLDIAVTPAGPVLIEINAAPDIVFQEQTCGPLLADVGVAREFARYDLLVNRFQRELAAVAAETSA